MSILPQIACFLLKEHRYRPIEGDVLLIGRQTVMLTERDAVRMLERESVPLRKDYSSEIDEATATNRKPGFITDRAFFSMFSNAKIMALDVSAYEGAEIVHDLNAPLPDRYRGVADFILNGSCMDNLFDPASAIKSMSKMLRPGGRVFHFEHGTPVNNAMLCYSPEWFFGFYAINDYADCQIFVCSFGNYILRPWRIFLWRPYNGTNYCLNNMDIGDFLNVVVAEKGDHSSDDKTPIQSHYRAMHDNTEEKNYIDKHIEFTESHRRFYFSRSIRPWHYFTSSILKTPLKIFLRHLGITIRRGPNGRYLVERRSNALGFLDNQ